MLKYYEALALAISLTFGLAASVCGQTAAPTAETSSAVPSMPSGKYRGRMTERGGTRFSDFELDMSQNSGMLLVYRSPVPCNRPLPVRVIGVSNGIVRLETSEGGIQGCDRVLELTISAGEIAGPITFPTGNVFDIKATRQQ